MGTSAFTTLQMNCSVSQAVWHDVDGGENDSGKLVVWSLELPVGVRF